MSPSTPLTRLMQRFRTWWWLKAIGTTAFMWGFFLFYFHLLEHPRVAPVEMPLLTWDGMLPFHPVAWVFYASLWIYTSLPAALQPSFAHLLYYGLAIALVCALGLSFFYWWPTMVPAGYGLPASHPWNLLSGVDAPGNAFPSLHVATGVFSAAWLDAQIRAMALGQRWRWGNAIWCVAIVLSTLSTRQHVLLDAIGGIALGAFTAWLTLAIHARCRPKLLPMTA
ncbi:MAG: phosphatase PAP2 family protein [Burkholderiales bacterium]|nr:MAG: phosphatase PAP2 family protein [Burkholderiales bacterium]